MNFDHDPKCSLIIDFGGVETKEVADRGIRFLAQYSRCTCGVAERRLRLIKAVAAQLNATVAQARAAARVQLWAALGEEPTNGDVDELYSCAVNPPDPQATLATWSVASRRSP